MRFPTAPIRTLPPSAAFSPPSRQRGIAAILIVLLTGIALTATALGVMSSVRGMQDKQMTASTATRAEMRAWNGVELVRLYLEQLDTVALSALEAGSIAIGGADGIEATVVRVDDLGSNRFEVTADISGRTPELPVQARASTTIRAVYAISSSGSSSGSPGNNGGQGIGAANIKGDLIMAGGMAILGGEAANINVDGNVQLGTGSIDAINRLQSTGNVTINSAIAVGYVKSNGSLSLTDGADVALAEVLGDVLLDGGSQIVNLKANGNLTIKASSDIQNAEVIGNVTIGTSSANNGAVTSHGNVTISGGKTKTVNTSGSVLLTGGLADTINAMGAVNWSHASNAAKLINSNSTVTYKAGNKAGQINALGDVSLTGAAVGILHTQGSVWIAAEGGVGDLHAQGNLRVDKNATTKAVVGGTVEIPTGKPATSSPVGKVSFTRIAGYSVPVTPVAIATIQPLQPFSMTSPVVDAYQLEAAANYAFKYENGKTVVTVRNVNGIATGTYVLTSDGNRKDLLCPLASATSSGCSIPGDKLLTLCAGTSPNLPCFTTDVYNSRTRWTLSSTSLAPGSIWFDGHVHVAHGIYFNTILSTGDITTSGSEEVHAPNVVGYGPVCANTASGNFYPNPKFAGLYPTDLCDTDTGTLRRNALANIALLAGGYKDGVYWGGTIQTGDSSDISGSVVAGHTLNTAGSTTIRGYVTSSGLGSGPLTNKLVSRLVLDLTNLPATFEPGVLPCMSSECAGPGTGSGATTATVGWTRYL